VAGLVVSQGPVLLGDRRERLLPATAVNAIGPDALTIHAGAETPPENNLLELPRQSAMTGRKVVTHSGRMLGVIADVLIAPEDGSRPAGRLEELFGNTRRDDDGDYIRAEADLRVGPDLVVVPDDAVVSTRSSNRLLEEDSTERQASPVRWLSALRRPGQGSAWLGGGKPVTSADPDSDINVPLQRVEAQPVQIHEARTRTIPVDGTPDL
jgi:uncharacterized protein YrrD